MWVETHKANVEGRARLLRVIGFHSLTRDGPIVRYRDMHLGKSALGNINANGTYLIDYSLRNTEYILESRVI